ncbi:MAG: helix-turn-helix transcriptional regulator [Deltaproteobacteria bacterium]|nr:helix-turn-helix transcriptional regulator [Deltaproteobacteria bacterium]
MPILFRGVAESLNIRLLSAGYITVDSWWAETDQLREFWRLYLSYQDGASLRIGDEIYTLPPERIVVVPAGIEFQAELEHPVDQFYIQFEFGRLKALTHLSIAEVLSHISEDRARSFLRIAEGQQELLDVLHYIDKHLDQSLNNSRLAEIALASESRFIRRFREATGRTPGRYVQDRRLRRAAELLVSTDQTIDHIAESCGFANRYYFTRVFAQRMGCPPARYRSDRPYLHGKQAGAA